MISPIRLSQQSQPYMTGYRLSASGAEGSIRNRSAQSSSRSCTLLCVGERIMKNTQAGSVQRLRGSELTDYYLTSGGLKLGGRVTALSFKTRAA